MDKTIVCACEDIALTELFSAISQGYAEIESLKRYTGIGTGKCQGKCCLVQTLRVLASEKGIAAVLSGCTNGPGEAIQPPNPDEMLGLVRMPTIRQPVTPLRIDDIVEASGESETE